MKEKRNIKRNSSKQIRRNKSNVIKVWKEIIIGQSENYVKMKLIVKIMKRNRAKAGLFKYFRTYSIN